MLAGRAGALAAEPGVGVAATADVVRSLIEIVGLLDATGQTGEALARCAGGRSRRASGSAGTDAAGRGRRGRSKPVAAGLAPVGWAGQAADALANRQAALADQAALAAVTGASAAASRDLAEMVSL